jgi:hypothetical protein
MTMSDQELDTAPPEGIPWINPVIQQQVTWRDGDIVVSVPVKSGTTWMMNIVHQLRSGGDADFADVYLEVPWLEFVPGPESRIEDLVAGFDAMPHDRRRAMKTHSAPGDLPYQEPGSGADVRYVVVARNPDEAVASVLPFLQGHTEAWFDKWGISKAEMLPPDLASLVMGMGDTLAAAVFGFVAAWWPLRNQPNVLLVHFADLKRDHEGSVRRVADFLGFAPTDAEWGKVLEYTSFAWMKAHEDKFELRMLAEPQILEPGAMVRKGQLGRSAEDGITAELSATIEGLGRQVLTDEAAFVWLYDGGPVPS